MNGLTIEQDLYSDYLVVNQGQATATRLSALLEGYFGHDRLTRSFNHADLGSAQLWQPVKPFVQQVVRSTGMVRLYAAMQVFAVKRKPTFLVRLQAKSKPIEE